MGFQDRLKEQREHIGMSRAELAEILGVTQAAIGNYENGVSTPKADILFKVFDALKCDANYLFQDEMNDLSKPFTFTVKEKEHIKKYRTLDEYGKDTVEAILERELYRTKEQKKNMFVKEKQAFYLCNPVERNYPEGIYALEEFKDEEGRISMPLYDIGASAGTGVFLDNPCYEVISMPEDRLSRKANFALWVSGDSMEPRFHDGDLVLVKIQPSVEPGEIGIFVLNGEGYIKKFGGDKLISLNPIYEPIIIAEDDALYCKGKVIGNV